MGILIASGIILLWAGHLLYSLAKGEVNPLSPLFYVHILVQTYLFTGLFITGHDAMHGTVSRYRPVNNALGFFSVFLYAGMWYPRLIKNHRLHHQFPGTIQDPDYAPVHQNFFAWWGRFMMKYLTVIQLVIMAVLFNVLKLWFPVSNIIIFWVVPAILSTFQLFYFGTYLPHKQPHSEVMQPHNARTLKRNHLWAMVSCYFFGYHYEHHEAPWVPWWKLYRTKSR
jgi:beta-carotene/zeaxanthin 4-ketolase